MYVVKWKDDNDYFTGRSIRSWSSDKKNTALYESKEEAKKAVLNLDPWWDGKFIILFMHPLNLNPV